MKQTITNKLFNTMDRLKRQVKESDFNLESYEWKECNRQRFKNISSSWRNICKKYRKFFDSHEDYVLDSNLFDFELRTMETKLILKYLYGAEAEHQEVFNLVVDSRKPAPEVAIDIINSLKYEIL